jgi:quercetin dioxygenase-like cupin family protein
MATSSTESRVFAVSVHVAPGASTEWHTHPHGQTIYVTEGVGRCQRRGGPVEEIRPGDGIFFEPGEVHWQGAAPDRLMAHVAALQSDKDGTNATWLERVTDEEDAQQPGQRGYPARWRASCDISGGVAQCPHEARAFARGAMLQRGSM